MPLGYWELFRHKTKRLDSLQETYQKEKTDTLRLLILGNIAIEYSTTQPDTTRQIAQHVLEESEKKGFESGKYAAYKGIGTFYFAKGNYPEALQFLQSCSKMPCKSSIIRFS